MDYFESVWLIFPSQNNFLLRNLARAATRLPLSDTNAPACCSAEANSGLFREEQFPTLGPVHTGRRPQQESGEVEPLVSSLSDSLVKIQKSKMGPNRHSQKCKKGTRNLTINFRRGTHTRGYLSGTRWHSAASLTGSPLRHVHEKSRSDTTEPSSGLCPLIGESRLPML